MLHAFINGFILALGLALPIGLQNIYLFNQGANQKRFFNVWPSIITATICDSFLIISAVLGITLVIFAIPWIEEVILGFGLLFLLYLGFVTWFSKPAQIINDNKAFSTRKQVIFTMSVSILNPQSVIYTIGVIGANSMHFKGVEKISFTAACILVSIVWYLVLTISGHLLWRIDASGNILMWLNKISALLIWLSAIYILWLFHGYLNVL